MNNTLPVGVLNGRAIISDNEHSLPSVYFAKLKPLVPRASIVKRRSGNVIKNLRG